MLAEPIRTIDMTGAILPHVACDNEVIRCAAVRALGRNGKEDPRSREVLLGLLRDPDPDVRSDAIEALAPLIQPEDAAVILESLNGDPVREVKLAAIQILVDLQDRNCIPQLRALVLSKCEDSVAWEDEIADWDDWLDVQVASIDALGALGVADSIDDLLAALDDEMGQTLDIPVFRALARMGKQGVIWLVAWVDAGKGLARKRAADALANADPALLRDHLDRLLAADDVALRLLGLSLLSVDAPQAEDITLRDASEHLRCAALRQFGEARPDWVIAALADPSEAVQATALELLPLPLPEYLHNMLTDNMLAWLKTGSVVLASAAASLLPKIAPNRAVDPLTALAVDDDRAIEARIAAIRGLGGHRDPSVTGILQGLLSDRSQQLRLVALHEIKSRAQSGDPEALSCLVQAIDGSLLDEDDAVQPLGAETAADIGMQKEEATGHLRISEDGEILRDSNGEVTDAGGSTLASLQIATPAFEAKSSSNKPKSKRRRVAIEGPDAVAEDLSCVAMDAAAGLVSVRIANAVLSQIDAPQDRARIAAWRALSTGFSTCLEAAQAAPMALSDAQPEVRRYALAVLIGTEQIDKYIQQVLEDSDTLVRADAVAQLRGKRLLDFVTDPAVAVRHAALLVVLNSGGGDAELVTQAIAQVFDSARVDTIAWGLQRSAQMRSEAVHRLADDAASGRDHFVILDALAVG